MACRASGLFSGNFEEASIDEYILRSRKESAREMASCTEQVSTNSETVAGNAKNLKEEVKNLSDQMNRFKI